MLSDKKWLVNVPVATVWTSYTSPRDIDRDAIFNPVQIDSWLKGLTYGPRLDLCNHNLVQTQVLFGQEVLVTEERKGWARVHIPDQPTSKNKEGYPGWIPIEQLIKHENWNFVVDPIVVVTSKKAFLYDENNEPYMELCFQTILPYLREQNGKAFVQTPSGIGSINVENIMIYESLNMIPKGNGKEIIESGEQFLHLPYLWGGVSSFGYDCSGFCYLMCKANGHIIPRDADDQAKAGVAVDLPEVKPGDLLFFTNEEGKGKINHVGIYYGQGRMIHSPSTGKSVEIIQIEGTKYETELCTARRYWCE